MGSLANVNDDLPRTTGYTVKDSGEREEFATGMVRDTQDGKSRPDLISPWFLERLGQHLRKGGEKYGEFNWQLGGGFRRTTASICRHLMQWMMGDTSEDHLCAMAFGIMCIVHHQEHGRKDLEDMPDWDKGKPESDPS